MVEGRQRGWRVVLLFLAPMAGLALGGALCSSQGPAQKVEPELRVIRPPDLTAGEPEGVRPEPAPTRAAPVDPVTVTPEIIQPIEDPSGRALEPFFALLKRIESGEQGLKARVVHYGDSHIAADIWSGVLRRRLQKRFGDGGHGFMLPAKPWRSYRHMDAENGVDSMSRWSSERARGKRGIKDRLYGLGGVTVWSSKKGASTWVGTKADGEVGRRVGEFEVYYLKQPGGGTFDLRLGGKRVQTVKTRARKVSPGYAKVTASDGPNTLELRVAGRGEVRLFGVVMEREASGVVYDSVGINGARATTSLQWDVDLWQAHLKRRAPGLLVTTYGTNEAASNMSPKRHADELRRFLRVTREAAPNAACLLIAPPDLGRKSVSEAKPRPGVIANSKKVYVYKTPQVLKDLVATQRAVAAEAGCAFWSTFDAMGGDGSIDRWARESPPRGGEDRIHLTGAGYNWVAEQLFNALMHAYDAQPGR